MKTTFVGIQSVAAAGVTDAWFRQFKNFSDALTAAGFPKTADTGQVDWTTVTVPAANVYSAYEIRRFNDADQSTVPIFIKIEYGHILESSTYYPRSIITIGTGSDGAGNITGALPSPIPVTWSASTTNRTWLLSSDGAGFIVLAGRGTNHARHLFGLERPRSTDGITVPRYLFMYNPNAGTTISTTNPQIQHLRVIDMATGNVVILGGIPAFYWRPLSASSTSLGVGSVYPYGVCQFPTELGVLRSKLAIGVAYNDFFDEAIIEVPRFSSNTLIKYRVELKEGSNFPGLFGMGGGTSTTNHPSLYAMPAIYWED